MSAKLKNIFFPHAIFVGSVVGYNILLELNNITSPVPVNALAFGTQNGNEGVWRVSNNQRKNF